MTLPQEPLVTVLIAAYNPESTLRQTMLTALGQTYRNIELIVVDDGSSDSTPAIVEDLARSDTRVRLLRRVNGGLSAALNTGLAAAGGEFIARLDADDFWHSSKLERQMQLAADEPDLAFVYCWVRYIDSAGGVVRDVHRSASRSIPCVADCGRAWSAAAALH